MEVTAIVHGLEKANKAQQTAKDLFAGGGSGTGNEPEVTIPKASFGEGMPAAEVLVEAGIAPSKGEAKRLIKQGGVAFNGQRIENINEEIGLNFLEFNYMLLQSYDFLELYRSHDVTLQLGGDDQWSNMLGGMELVRRVERDKAFCLTVPFSYHLRS